MLMFLGKFQPLSTLIKENIQTNKTLLCHIRSRTLTDTHSNRGRREGSFLFHGHHSCCRVLRCLTVYMHDRKQG